LRWNYTRPVHGVSFKWNYNIMLYEFTVYIDIIDFIHCLIFWVKDFLSQIYLSNELYYYVGFDFCVIFFLLNKYFSEKYRYCLLSRNTDRIIFLSITLTAVYSMRRWEKQILPDTNFNFNSDLSSTQTRVSKHFPLSRQQYFTTAVYLGCSTVFGLHTAQTSI